MRSFLFAFLSLCCVVVATGWAWRTFDFWEVGPLLGSMGVAGVLAGISAWYGVSGKATIGVRVLVVVLSGIVVSLITFVTTYVATVRWTR
jgi:hypothetical protein